MIDALIVNADDLGFCEGNTLGIFLAHLDGIVTSTTVMMNMPYARKALLMARDFPSLGVGVHLNITAGMPLIKGDNTFVKDGRFIPRSDYPDHKPHADPEELYREFKAQIDAFIDVTGHKPTHIDSHHHVHLQEDHIAVAKRLAREYDLPMRQREQVLPDVPYARVAECFYGDFATPETITTLCESRTGIVELMCHPGLIDQRLCDISSYSLPRMKELHVLRMSSLKDYFKQQHIQLIHFQQLKDVKIL